MPLSNILPVNDQNKIWTGPGALEQLVHILPHYDEIIIFNDKNGFIPCGAADFFSRIEKRIQSRFRYFPYAGKALPIEDIETVYQEVRKTKEKPSDHELIVAVGGGTVMDLAKIFSLAYSNNCQTIEEAITAPTLKNMKCLVLIPTTAGTGSEATSFAVVYKDKVKYSVDNQSLLPRFTVLDPLLLRSLPGPVLNSTILDALAQAVESTWAKGSTHESRLYSRQAIQLILKHLDETSTTETIDRLNSLLLGSHLAGKAINISRTTLAHSISYPMTSYYEIAHGTAVFLTLPAVAELNAAVDPGSIQEGMTPGKVAEAFAILCDSFAVKTAEQLISSLRQIMPRLGFSPRLRDYGITAQNIPFLAAHALTKGRSDNNPRKVDSLTIQKLLQSIL